ncbi:MAG: amino acid ABC transporter substrate-binding protein [Pseudomonadota bacterium]|uniref:amino acid ABC transporter substrate-binding protein n=1 Tax=Pseudooceanicola nitratireducens TaxID=517719 RepID=UPI001C960F73|nr:amino acid ABC transporter substrate-binding protein [Pseudooceanicola nitratireducens]MBY6158927.1 amino acid ABC transporter substrate-binding protein [Pseudooceanicola nitratireducens]MEC7794817.1 amino acid ABC transporter substrate-binding protein [Pseudomonadota bacterium]MEC8667665.1 amino acid ABC transporter substrate-binding protein [Pseudomonadota bacterium]MEC9102621.1 amino acid ABC transporter substrate-binding protein [Pseudomonadota bacterium]
MTGISRRAALRALSFGVTSTLALTAGMALAEGDTVKIGYAVARTGPSATGAGITTIPNYELWVDSVNKAGGLTLPDGSKKMIEVVEYDNRSANQDLVRAIERLASQDKVDLILPPWGTGANLAIAPLMAKFGYPQLAVTAVTDKAPEFAARWDRSFWMLGGGHDYAKGLVDVLTAARDAGTINGKVAVVSVADGFGIDLINGARPAFEEAGFELVYDKTYPLGTSDFAALMSEAQGSGADSFVAFSYPPGSFGMTKTAQSMGYNPKVFYISVGGAFPIYPGVADGKAEGVMAIGGVNADSPAIQDYFARHTEFTGKAPDSWASAITYASLEMLEQAVERVGLDHAALAAELSGGTFETVIGEVKLEDNQLRDLWWVGQWQGGAFRAVNPGDKDGASAPVIPKPEW